MQDSVTGLAWGLGLQAPAAREREEEGARGGERERDAGPRGWHFLLPAACEHRPSAVEGILLVWAAASTERPAKYIRTCWICVFYTCM